MKNYVLFIALSTIPLLAIGQNPSQDSNWELDYQDNFNSFNTSVWSKANNYVHGSNSDEEPQVYTANNAYIENGKLILRTIEQIYPCPKGNNCYYGGTHQYTSGQVNTISTYHYGYYEIYAKLPTSSGYWPAFWFWDDNQSNNCWYNEIDVFEMLGNNSYIDGTNIHTYFGCPIDYDQLSSSSEDIPLSFNFSSGYHWYSVKWTKNQITWYIDHNPVRGIANNKGGIGIQHPMYIIFNVALYPPAWGENDITNNTIFPNYMYIDKFNIYHLKCDKNTVINEIYNYNTFNYAVKKSITLSSVSSLQQGDNISLKATDFIEIKSGFEVPLGATLKLEITSCE